jgi:aspartyl protease
MLRRLALSGLLPVLPASVLVFQGCAALPETGTYRIRAQIHKDVEVPLVSVDGVPFIQAHVNGAGPFWFVVDTGAETDTVNSRLADRLQLQKVTSAWLNETVEGDWCKGVDVNIGGAHYRPERVAATAALGDVEKAVERPVDGVLGQGFFRCFMVELDYRRQVLRLHHGRRFRPDGQLIPITFVGFRPVIKATIEIASMPSMSGSFSVDTGADSELELADHFLERHGFDESASALFPSERMMLHGRVGVRYAYGVRLQVGAFSVQKPLVQFGGDNRFSYNELCDGLIGSGFLRNFHVVFDYSRERLWLKAPE